MERYKLEIVNDQGESYIRGEPAPEGSWVMFKDVVALEARADRNAAGYARVDAEARRAEFLHKQKISAMQKRIAKLEAAVRTLKTERDQLIGALQIAVERSGDIEHPPAWVDAACDLLNQGFLKVDRAALEGRRDDPAA